MIYELRILKYAAVLGLSASLLFGCEYARAGEGKWTKPVVQPRSQLQSEASSNSLAQAERGEVESGWQGFRRGVVHGFTRVFKDWRNPLGADLPSDPASASAASVQKVTLGEDVILKKVATEEYTLIEGATVQPSRSTALQQAVSLSRAAESLIEAGIDLRVVRAEIGARIADMLGDELRGTTSTGTAVTIDGNVWEKARIDWYAKTRAGKVILAVNGAAHELQFEYTIGFVPRVAGTPRRAAAPSSTSESSVGRVTTVSANSPDLFEARFETKPAFKQGDKLPVFRGGVNAKCIGYCEVVAVRGPRIVGRCDRFRPKVGDCVGKPEAAH